MPVNQSEFEVKNETSNQLKRRDLRQPNRDCSTSFPVLFPSLPTSKGNALGTRLMIVLLRCNWLLNKTISRFWLVRAQSKSLRSRQGLWYAGIEQGSFQVIPRCYSLRCKFSFVLSCISVLRRIHGNLGISTVEGSEIIEPEEWHHLALRFNAQSKRFSFFLLC